MQLYLYNLNYNADFFWFLLCNYNLFCLHDSCGIPPAPLSQSLFLFTHEKMDLNYTMPKIMVNDHNPQNETTGNNFSHLLCTCGVYIVERYKKFELYNIFFSLFQHTTQIFLSSLTMGMCSVRNGPWSGGGRAGFAVVWTGRWSYSGKSQSCLTISSLK